MARLDAEVLFGAVTGRLHVGRTGEILDECESTMDVARDRLADGCEDGHVVLTELQTAGRGRTGGWDCPAGAGLLMSVVFRLGLPAAQQRLVILVGAVAATEALRGLGVHASIKWPNDVVVAEDDAGRLSVRKLAGLIVERIAPADGPACHILGMGLNVNQGPAELPPSPIVPATSMRIEKGRAFDRGNVCRAVLRELDAWYRVLARGEHERILARWRTLSCLLGRDIVFSLGSVGMSGRVTGIRAGGQLLVRTRDGRELALSDGDAKLLLN